LFVTTQANVQQKPASPQTPHQDLPDAWRSERQISDSALSSFATALMASRVSLTSDFISVKLLRTVQHRPLAYQKMNIPSRL
jgi:hypothetical protein